MTKRVGAIIIFTVSAITYLALAIYAPNVDPRGIFIFAATGAAWLGLHGENEAIRQKAEEVEKRAVETAAVMTKIHRQTDGVLDKRIEDSVRKVLREMFLEHDAQKVKTAAQRRTRVRKSIERGD